MRIFKFVLLTVIRLAFVAILKAVIFVYMLSRPEGPLVAITRGRDSRRGDTFSNAIQKAGVAPARTSSSPDAHF
jgi:hypothetical protein